ncbi:MAG TPA: VOC family protein [Ferruginibacter sp.]|nr:VOC family protein [Ferruginibacter sp.]
MQRVTGVGGVFLKSKDAKALAAWYEKHLGVPFAGNSYCEFKNDGDTAGSTVFSFFKNESDYFSPSEKPFMINFRVKDLDELIKVLKEEAVEIVGEPQSYDYGKFGWCLDPEGNKIELWQPL